MAQLPDENVIALPQPGSARRPSSIDVSGYARGAAAMASGVETLGKGITSAATDVWAVIKQERAAEAKLELARAQAHVNTALINHGIAVHQETDPADLEQNFRKKIDDDIAAAAQSIGDPRQREMFVLGTQEHAARLVNAAKTRAFTLAREAGEANDRKALNQLSEGAIRSPDPAAMQIAVQSARDIINGWTWVDRPEAEGRMTGWAQGVARGKLNALPLPERHAAFTDGSSPHGPLVEALPTDERGQMRIRTQREFAQAQAKRSDDALNATRQTLADASNGLAPLPSWESIDNNPHLHTADKNRARTLYDTAVGEAAGLQRFMTRFDDPNAGPFDPYDPDERKFADKAFVLLGGKEQALRKVVTRTRMLPRSAGVQLHNSMMSDDPKRVADALTISANLYSANSHIFIGVDGQTEFENNAVAFRHYVDTRGMSADEAARRIIRDRSPEYQAGVKARLKVEDVDRKLRRLLNVGDLAGEFSQMSWTEPFDPKVGFDPATRKELFEHYTEAVKDRYLETGDFALAKVQAADQLKRVWGVTRVNGSQAVMPYPPERAPAYAGIVNAASYIAAHAIDAIKAGTGEEVDRSRIMLWPIPGVTATQYKSGRTPSYRLMWFDKRGNVQTLPGNKAFEALPSDVRAVESRADEAQARQAVDAARRLSGVTTTGDFGHELEGGFLNIPEGVEPPTKKPREKPRETLPGIGDVAIPGGFLPQTPDAGPSADKSYETFWQQGRGGRSFRGAVPAVPGRPARNTADKK